MQIFSLATSSHLIGDPSALVFQIEILFGGKSPSHNSRTRRRAGWRCESVEDSRSADCDFGASGDIVLVELSGMAVSSVEHMKDSSDRTKVVVRHLPPSISQSVLMEQIDGRFAGRYDWVFFRPGKNR
ncbi:hypothetical protein BHE74_00009804 [Ensete ventricosum]|nr:hypothetical protein BHE74_00009804 [Ensete ventricosum]